MQPSYEKTKWVRVRKDRPCPICGKLKWCLLAADESAAICARVESGKRAGKAGWLHRLANNGWRPSGVRTIRLADRQPSRQDLPWLARNYQTAVNPSRLQRLADALGLSVASLKRLGIGWASDSGAWAFPMTDPAGKLLGIRLRLESARKFSVAGGREGLFIPSELSQAGPLLICEGPTDTGALLDLGFAAVGRPSCRGGVPLLVELAQARKPAGIVIVADGDAPGQSGADDLASVLALYCPAVRIVTPPNGIKDARAWKQAGATAADVLALIEAAPACKLRIGRNAQAVRP
jgi:hypothetical protein